MSFTEQLAAEVASRRTFAIISHPDAGKTTITEKLLLWGKAIQVAGTVKSRKSDRHATSDWMAMEQQRGISITTSVMQFPYKDATINLLDTPGHEDFSEDTYRTLTAVDSALMVIDGGKGQLNAAVTAMRDVAAPRVAVIGLAKREEEVFLPGQSAPVMLDADSPALLVLRQIRDEAHRFALRQNRRGRSNSATQSVLETIPGVGPTRRKALLAHFGSIDAVMAASSEELAGVPGLPAATARQIHTALHRIGGRAPGASQGGRRAMPDADA